MSDSPLKRLLVQTSHYGLTSLLTMLAGIVSFPLLTRLFSVADYGAMSLIGATVTIAVALGKLGIQHSILRYHSEISAGKSRFDMQQLVSTTFYGMFASGVVVVLALVLATQVIPASWLGDVRLRGLFAIASLVVLAQVLESALLNILRAEQLTTAYMKYQVAKKYLSIGFILAALLLITTSLVSFYTATVLSEMVAVAILMFILFGNRARERPVTGRFSRPLYLELVSLGIPMMIGYEMSGVVLAVGDRYVIGGLMGEESLGLYAAAYGLCQMVQAVVVSSVGQAIMPIYMQMWDQQGKEETSRFISRSLGRYVIFGAPVVAGLAAVGPSLLPLLASAKYASAGSIMPWVIAGMVVDGTNSMVGAGLFIHRKTRIIMAIVMSGAISNIVLNLVLVPHIGILGAAIATLASYAVTSLALAWAGRHLLPVAIPWASLLRAGAAAFAMYWSVIYLLPGRGFFTVGVRTAVGAVVYGAIMLLIDRDAKALLRNLMGRFGKKGQP